MVKTGIAFGDYVFEGDSKKRSWSYENNKNSNRGYFLPLVFVILFVALFARLFFLQIIEGHYYRYLSDNNRTKSVVIHAPRGIIFDRNGVPLVYNLPGFREEVNGKTVFLSQDEALSLIAQGNKNLEIDSLREYPYKDDFAHVLGYIGQISKEELSDPVFANYSSGDIIGKAGIEQEYETRLKGTDGKQLFEVDAKGSLTRKLGQDDPIPGENITLTLDAKLQEVAFDAMKDAKKGAAIVSTPNGEILALVSKPSFDPNLFTMGRGYKVSSGSSYLNLSDVLSDSQNQPLLNRTIAGVYPPGSTFKLVVASAALRNKIIDENYQVLDTGILRVGDFSFSNWFYTDYGGTDGEVNVVKGITRSNDIFFYKLAEKTGVDTISQTGVKFGLGARLGIDLQGEQGGVLPTKEWKLKNVGEQWYLGDTYHYGIGQGFLLVTPLQVNAWTQAIANGGKLYQPHLLKDQEPIVKSQDLLDEKSVNLIREGMVGSCNPGGEAWPLYGFKVKNAKLKVDGKNILSVASASADMRQITIACKTGTAEAPNNQDPHAWITLFVPAYNPQIVVTILSENSGMGSNVAAPIAKQILDSWFGR